MKVMLLVALAFVQATCSTPPVPVMSLPNVPGEIDPTLTKEVICDPSWSTSKVRPPVSFTEPIKKRLFAEEHLPGSLSDYELDHDIPLELGGAPRSLNNLWMEPRNGAWNAADKDKLENRMHVLVCSDVIPLDQAQREIAANWIDAYKRYVQ